MENLVQPKDTKLWFVFHQGNLCLATMDDGSFAIPMGIDNPLGEVDGEVLDINDNLQGQAICAVKIADKALQLPESFVEMPLRESFNVLDEDAYIKAGKCSELLYWHDNTRFCGHCGGKMQFSSPISKVCTQCGREVWPLLATAVIVLVRRGDKALLVHANNFKGNYYGLVAGFVETGETLEEAVTREVKEETGITISNISYFGSQPWPYPCGLMVGFTADYVDGEIELQLSELSQGGWFDVSTLPNIPSKLSIARKLIDDWKHKNQTHKPI